MAGELLAIEGLHVKIPIGSQLRTVVRDVSVALAPGEALGLVGESGSGKSMTARAIMRLLSHKAQVTGAIRFDGHDVMTMSPTQLRDFRTSRVSMIHQDPRTAINPVRTIGDFLLEVVLQRGRPRQEAYDCAVDLLSQVGIPDGARRMKQYPHQLSGGLLQRIMIAGALLTDPDLLLADEPTTALDVTTQEEVMAILEELRVTRSLAMLFITHDLDLAAAVTNRMAVMYAGTLVEVGPPERLQDDARHPYTAGLLGSRPEITHRSRIKTIPGRPISAFEVDNGCVFRARCPFATARCRDELPALRNVDDRLVACHRAEELHGSLRYPDEASA